MATTEQAKRLKQEDRRADGAVREVRLERRSVVISRRFQGIAMQVGVPVSAYRGIVLTLTGDTFGRPLYRLSLRHADADLSVELMQTHADDDIVAEWKYYAAYFCLPKFIERQPGVLEGAEARIGCVGLGRARPQRRRGAAVTSRRPRILSRRKPGRAVAGAEVHRDERVIVSYE
jgi:hypothetical protein